MALQHQLDEALARSKELEEELKAFHLSKDTAVAMAYRELQVELQRFYLARLYIVQTSCSQGLC